MLVEMSIRKGNEVNERGKKNRYEESERDSNRGRSSNRGRNSYAGSIFSNISEDRLSSREIGKIKRWMFDRKKEERRNIHCR